MLFSLLYFLVRRLLGAGGHRPDEKDIELLVLRHQEKVLQRPVKRPRLNRLDRVLLAAASRAMTRSSWSSFVVRPETLLSWHRELVRECDDVLGQARRSSPVTWCNSSSSRRRSPHGPDEPARPRRRSSVYDRFRAIPDLAPDEIMPAFIRTQLASGVEAPPSPPGPPPPWMPSRLLAIGGFMAAFDAYEPDFGKLREFDRPVYFALGGQGNPDLYARMAARIGELFPDVTLEVYEDRHHFDPPHRVEPARLASALRQLWARAESTQAATVA